MCELGTISPVSRDGLIKFSSDGGCEPATGRYVGWEENDMNLVSQNGYATNVRGDEMVVGNGMGN